MNDRPALPTHSTLSIDGACLWRSLHELAAIGATAKGGVCRLALTELDAQARRQLIDWAQAAGCTIRIDEIGNIFARRAGTDPAALPVATGSHIDTQPTGGKFDGNYGVLAGLEVIRTLNDAGIVTRAPLELCIWTNEEGSRFVPVMMGSGVYAGAFSLEHALAARDRDGVSVAQALAAIDFAGAAPAAVAGGAQRFAAYFEAHIEQGPVLEAAGCTIGVVSGALGQRWYDLTVQGQEAHAGPTPMPLRRDALFAAAQLMQQVVAIAHAQAPDGRGTVGYVDVFPNSRNVIPGRVRFSVDFRHLHDEGLAAMEAAVRATAAQVQSAARVQIDVQQVVYFPPTAFDAGLQASIRASASARGYAQMALPSGAGHDAIYVARTAPAAMIFVPCKDGISHNEIEEAKASDLAAGANVLLDALLAQAGVA